MEKQGRPNLINKRVGVISKNNYGSLMKVIEYNDTHDIWVQFEKGIPVHTQWNNFIIGNVKNPYDKTVYGIGYIGEGKYIVSKDKKVTIQYDTWRGMIQRCYHKKFQEKNPTYKGCIVSEEWHNFQNFAKWYDENFYQLEGEEMHLDKDILVKGNKIYSPETCVFVPKRINSLFNKKKASRGDTLIGVFWEDSRKKYMAQCMKNGKVIKIGRFNNIEDAFNAYKVFKENLIKQIAEYYKNKIPEKLYDAMITYQVEITD
jgi:hypothetical protein